MRSFFSYISKNIKNVRWARLVLLGLLVGSSCFADNANSDGINLIVQLLDVVFTMISAILTPAVILAGWLLSPDWTMGDFFGLRKYFLNVWVLVSNLVYIAFALILLFMAVMQIFGGESSEYTFKQKLPKFLVGILMVPFTWLIVSWTLSFANQATAAVLSIPMGAIAQMQDTTDGQNKGVFHDKVIPTHISLNLKKDGANKATEVDCKNLDSNNRTACISAAEFVANNGSGPYFIMMVYAYDIFKIQQTAIVKLTDTCKANVDAQQCIKNLTDILIKFGTALIVTFFFGILTIALCWVLLMRAFKLWLYIMFSPLFGIAYFTGGKGWGEALGSEGGGGESSGLTSLSFFGFFQLAMVPVMVSGVLSFGLLFIGVISQTFSVTNMTTSGTTSGEKCTASSGFLVRYCITPTNTTTQAGNQGYTSKLVIGTSPDKSNTKGEYVPITFEFGDMFSGFVGDATTDSAFGAGKGVVDSVESIFAHIILTIIALVVIWIGVKIAVSYDEVTRVAFEPFAKMGDSVQTFVSHIPSYIPTPHPAFKALTGSGMNIAKEAMDKFTEAMDEKHIHEPARNLGELLGNQSLRQFNSEIQQARGNLDGLNKALATQTDRQLAAGVGFEGLKKSFEDTIKASTIEQAEKDTIIKKIEQAKTTSDIQDILSVHRVAIDKAKEAGGSARSIIERTEKVVGSPSSSGGTTLKNTHEIVSGDLKLKAGRTIDSQQKIAIKDSFGNNKNSTPADIKRELIDHLGFDKDEVNKMSDDQATKARTELLKQAG